MTPFRYGDPTTIYGVARYASATSAPSPTGGKRRMSKVALNISRLPDAEALNKAQTAATGCAGAARSQTTIVELPRR